MANIMFAKLTRMAKNATAFCMRKNNRIITWFALLGACIFILTPIINPLIQIGEQWYLGRTVTHANKTFAAQEAFIDQNLTSLASSDELKQLIKSKDLSGLETFFRQERAKRGFDLMLATDDHGVALLRSSLLSNRGDYIFNVTAWGQAVSENQRAITIERGVTYPLIMIGGQELFNNDGSLLGAIFIGHQMGDEYLADFKKTSLPGIMDAVLYTKQDGAIASTIINPDVSGLIPYYFTPTSRWAQQTLGIGTPELIALNHTYYFAQNLMFPGLQTSPGGLIILFPNSPLVTIVIFVLLFTLIFGCILHFSCAKREPTKSTRAHLKRNAGTLAGFVIFTLFLAFFANMYYSAERATYIPRLTPTLYNSTLSLQPDADIFTNAVPHTITVSISSGGELINAIEATVTFDPSLIVLEKIDLSESICNTNLFSSTSIDQTKGVATISCATPPSGFKSQNGIIARITIMPKHTGQYKLAFDMAHTHVFASDGLGTDVLRSATGGSYQIKTPSDAPIMPALPVFSLSDPNSERWYSSQNISLSWDPNKEYTSYVYAFNSVATTEPSLPSNTNSISLTAFQDGVYYFHLAGMRGSVRGPSSHFKIMIDATPPENPVILTSSDTVMPNKTVRINVSSFDATSGLQRFMYVRVNNTMFLPFTSPTSYSFPRAGTYQIVVRAIDNADNWSETTHTIRVQSPSFFKSISNLLPAAAGAFIQSLHR